MATYAKYYKQVKQVSYDSGNTWQNTNEYRRGAWIENDSTDCGYIGELLRTIEDGTLCLECDLHQQLAKQISYNGLDWDTYAYEVGRLIEADSYDCGYVPPQPKFIATYSGGTSYSAMCDSATTLTSGDTKPSGYTAAAMTDAVIGDCITTIGISAFTHCRSLSGLTIPNSVTAIGTEAFYGCTSLSSVTIPNSVTDIGNSAFYYCGNLTSVTIPNSVTNIGSGAFYYCTGLNSATIGSGVTVLNGYTFGNCGSLHSVTLPNRLRYIDNYAFVNCVNLSTVDIPERVEVIGRYAFAGCASLTSVTIPYRVIEIDDYAFVACEDLTSITCLAETPPTLGAEVFGATNNCPIYVPSILVDEYKAASGWSTYADRIQAIPT